jgi:hypothetical protein
LATLELMQFLQQLAASPCPRVRHGEGRGRTSRRPSGLRAGRARPSSLPGMVERGSLVATRAHVGIAHRTRLMRLRLALAAIVLVAAGGPGWAGVMHCTAHPRQHAHVWVQEGDLGPMKQVKGDIPAWRLSDDEVDHLDTTTPKGPWIWTLHTGIFRLPDVELFGDCTRIRVDDLG